MLDNEQTVNNFRRLTAKSRCWSNNPRK